MDKLLDLGNEVTNLRVGEVDTAFVIGELTSIK